MHFPANVENFGTYTFGVQINLYLWGKIGNTMNAARESMLKLIMEAFCEAIEKAKDDSAYSLTDMYVGFKPEDLSLSFYDDNDVLLQQITLDESEELKESAEEPSSELIALLRQALDAPEVDAAFGSLDTVAPVSVVLINEDKEPVCELKTFDNEMLFLEDDILKKMGQELDEFFEQLMSDVK